MATLSYAQTLPELEAQLASTQAQLQQLQSKLGNQQAATLRLAAQAQAATQALLQAQAYPASVWQAASLFQGRVSGAPLLAATAHAQAARLATLQTQNSNLFKLYGQLQAQQTELAAVANAIRQTESRSQRRQRATLAQAGRDASQLSVALTAALAGGGSATVPKPDPLFTPAARGALPIATSRTRQQPLAGRVVVGFRQGEGAEREGVVLAAPAGSIVKSPLAGKVLFAEGFRQFGGLVIVEGADGHEEVLGGLGAFNVLAGQTIHAGQAVGELGPRGRLYWEVRVRGLARNPLLNL